MTHSQPTVRLLGLSDPAKVAENFASGLVDIAYAESTDDSSAELSLEGVDLRKSADRRWITDILRHALSECGEAQATIEFLPEQA
jgi:hypothetical protein